MENLSTSPSGSALAAALKNTEKPLSPIRRAVRILRNFFFPFPTCEAITISDLGLSAYLLYRGCNIVRVVVIGKRASFTIEGKGLKRHVNDYYHCRPIKFPPFVMFQMREKLKDFIVATPFNDSTVFPRKL